ncbi:hypothetical protein DOM22_13330 [Bdellovibrio sp. ZAP7]|uniref:putative Ig domain-containing protein n=1 Tax=Bdellovibrio sp. ZAP7 TaxID=2231053 RepID=UPI00115792DC|nr:putative Ig domain-containing protein [Bdellovibrio sp. ZAP7]QDK46068.1 hypothetical protein DOM22_13330 [Bdellovibrio sp. ZAP7]
MRAYLLTILSMCLILGCSKSELSSSGSQNSLSSSEYYVSGTANTRVFYNAPTDAYGLGTFVTELGAENGSLVIPSTLTKGDYGVRTDPAVPQPLDLTVKVYRESHPSGDFIFEAPLLSSQVTVTNVTTAVFWLLKWGFNIPNVKVSQNTFNSIANSVELVCQNCRTQTNSQVLTFLLSRNDIIAKITNTLASENPSLSISYNWAPAVLYYVWSSPVLTTSGYGAKSSKQLETISADVVAVNPLNSTARIQPTSWLLTRNDSSTETVSGSPLIYTFTSEDQESVDFNPTFTDSADLSSRIKIHYEVARANRDPVCNEPIQLVMKANRINSFSLTAYCRDLDNPVATPNLGVTYSLVSGPSGMTINSSGVLRWSPTNALAGNTYNFEVLVTTMTSATHVAKGTITVNSVQIPVFASTITGAFTEGISSDISIPVTNPEGDPLILSVVGVTTIKNGTPSGAGNLTNYTSDFTNPIAPSFVWSFIPSYLQMIGSDGSFSVTFRLKYNTSADSNLDGTMILATQTVVFNLTNTDDPPVWDVNAQGGSFIEGTTFSVSLGVARDPNPNPTAMTFALQSSDSSCDWSSTTTISFNSSTGEVRLDGYPAFDSENTCSFQVVATDQNLMATKSQVFYFDTVNTNRPITEITSPNVDEIDGTENQTMSIPVAEMFSDPDLDIQDSREDITWTCMVNTTGLGSPYTDTCLSMNIKFKLSSGALTGAWNPDFGTAGTYYVELTATDVGGVSASHKFKMVIAPSPAPMVVTVQQGGIDTTMVTTAEGVTTPITLHAVAKTQDAQNIYSYIVSGPTCYVTIGGGSCRAAMIKAPSTVEGSGDQDFIYNIATNFTDGDNPLPGTSKTYILNFTVTKTDDPTIYSQVAVTVQVDNTNRAPTSIGLTSGSNGCTGSTANSLTTAFTICINLAQNSKSGNSWQKSYTNTLSYVDADGTNDSYSLGFTTTSAPGSINTTSNVWTIKLPSCLNTGTGIVSRTYYLKVQDGRGGTYQREIIMKFQNAAAASSCL